MAFTSEAQGERAWLIFSSLLGIAVGGMVLVWPSILGARAPVRHRRVHRRARHPRDRGRVLAADERRGHGTVDRQRAGLDLLRDRDLRPFPAPACS
jgi:mRNA-degrading endonuclease toxin of MazEF toxin-antitoxin module